MGTALMPLFSDPLTPHEFLQQEVHTYQKSLGPPRVDWPADVRVFMRVLQQHLFDSDVTIGALRQTCGLCDNNFSMRFAECVGMTPKAYQLHHRLVLAKRWLCHAHRARLSMTQIAINLGFDSLSSFTKAFQRCEGIAPSQYSSHD